MRRRCRKRCMIYHALNLETERLRYSENVSPKLGWVFRALDMVAPDKIRVVILGQDPTPQKKNYRSCFQSTAD